MRQADRASVWSPRWIRRWPIHATRTSLFTGRSICCATQFMVWPSATWTSTIAPRCGSIRLGKRRWSGTEELASSPTLSGLENGGPSGGFCFSLGVVEKFIASFQAVPTELDLDFDVTDDRVCGQQEGRAFPGCYGTGASCRSTCSAASELLMSYLRPSKHRRRPNTAGRFWPCWSKSCARHGPG